MSPPQLPQQPSTCCSWWYRHHNSKFTWGLTEWPRFQSDIFHIFHWVTTTNIPSFLITVQHASMCHLGQPDSGSKNYVQPRIADVFKDLVLNATYARLNNHFVLQTMLPGWVVRVNYKFCDRLSSLRCDFRRSTNKRPRPAPSSFLLFQFLYLRNSLVYATSETLLYQQ